jgi:Fe2+ or Zn2+ uptake regulation protein
VYRPSGLSTVLVVCDGCGTTFDLDRREADTFVERVATVTGITLELTHFPLRGMCAACGADAAR